MKKNIKTPKLLWGFLRILFNHNFMKKLFKVTDDSEIGSRDKVLQMLIVFHVFPDFLIMVTDATYVLVSFWNKVYFEARVGN